MVAMPTVVAYYHEAAATCKVVTRQCHENTVLTSRGKMNNFDLCRSGLCRVDHFLTQTETKI